LNEVFIVKKIFEIIVRNKAEIFFAFIFAAAIAAPVFI